jgi:uncharacterized OB-fold protein
MSEHIAPLINTLNAPFWEGARAGRLMLPHCEATNRAFWPPSPVSPYRAGAAIVWREVRPQGAVTALAIYRRVFLKAFEPLTPYGIAMVEVEEGVRLQAHVSNPASLSAGDQAALSFRVLIAGNEPVLVASRLDPEPDQ